MKLVSTVKLQRTREKAEECKPYFNHMYATVTSMLARTGIVEHPYLKSGKSGKRGVIVISSNRGLAGGYNSNIVKMLTQGELEGKELLIYNIGRKGHEALERKGYEIAEDFSSKRPARTVASGTPNCSQVLCSGRAAQLSPKSAQTL